MKREDFNNLSQEQQVTLCIGFKDILRLDTFGGYTSKWTIENGKVYIASVVDGSREPTLEIYKVEDYIKEALALMDNYIDPEWERESPNWQVYGELGSY